MSSPRPPFLVLLALAACGGQSVGAQSPAPVSGPDDPARAYYYEIAPEQVLDAQEAGFIEVTGTASVAVSPDRAKASFAVETRSGTAREAGAENASVMQSVLTALRASDSELDIETFGYTLRPEYGYTTASGNERTRVITGYVAVNNVRVTTEDVDAVGRVIDVATEAGANRISSLTFEASEPDEARREALALAVSRARAEAEAIASALGHALGAPLEVRGGVQEVGPRPMAMAMELAQARADTPIEAGDQTVNASVTVKFAIGQRGASR